MFNKERKERYRKREKTIEKWQLIKIQKACTRAKQSKKMETETHMCTRHGASWESCVYKLIWDLHLLFSIDNLLWT